MKFREYKIGSRMFGLAFGLSMTITLLFPSFDLAASVSSEVGLDKQLAIGWDSGWQLSDPTLLGLNKPLKILVKKDPKSGKPIEPAIYAYVYPAGTSLPNGVIHTANLGHGVEELSIKDGRITEAQKKDGAVFIIKHSDHLETFEGRGHPLAYVENATATMGWTPDDVIKAAADTDILHAGSGKTMFVREGCWWCHTLLPEQTQDWQVFGAPPMLGDFNGMSPTSFGSDRKGPDLLHVGSRNASREWMMLHFFNPRLVQPHSIMPRFDYLWGKVDAKGDKIDFAKWRKEYDEYREGQRTTPPDVPMYAKDSEIRNLIDFVVNLK
ncbi:MAG: cbb3-type cytochrome c oxidase subunit II [Candidatus Nitrotoga sp.]|nr:cbb3-type cytochrome c oxidase subunit II [Candidatus Nitrotoga sp.]MBP0116893.1 cbb3-type cytochrome c oxidase subunit II [Candidatus Nitrotoga sp.]MBP0123290.1 cbb3-type cytochrome c oxidase subunit II [Candidatus Nitrotoga sp.]MBP0126022.1 cbb3-type cytochrome c oxidase subunit II [Candidatus Nitrotoga sp.]